MEPAPPDPEAMEPTNAHSPDSWVGSEEARSMHETTTSRREGASRAVAIGRCVAPERAQVDRALGSRRPARAGRSIAPAGSCAHQISPELEGADLRAPTAASQMGTAPHLHLLGKPRSPTARSDISRSPAPTLSVRPSSRARLRLADHAARRCSYHLRRHDREPGGHWVPGRPRDAHALGAWRHPRPVRVR
jgi:hypothetical protein